MEEFKGRVWLLGLGGSIIIALFTFSIGQVDAVKAWTREYVDVRHNQVLEILKEIKAELKEIKHRLK